MTKTDNFKKLLLDEGFTSLREIELRLFVKGNQYIAVLDYGEDGYDAFQNITTKNILISKDMIAEHPEITICKLQDDLKEKTRQVSRRNMQIRELKKDLQDWKDNPADCDICGEPAHNHYCNKHDLNREEN